MAQEQNPEVIWPLSPIIPARRGFSLHSRRLRDKQVDLLQAILISRNLLLGVIAYLSQSTFSTAPLPLQKPPRYDENSQRIIAHPIKNYPRELRNRAMNAVIPEYSNFVPSGDSMLFWGGFS